jgi:hypothetical protein
LFLSLCRNIDHNGDEAGTVLLVTGKQEEDNRTNSSGVVAVLDAWNADTVIVVRSDRSRIIIIGIDEALVTSILFRGIAVVF